MMKYKVGEELSTETQRLKIKILSFKPGAQMTIIKATGINYYDVDIGGRKVLMSEPMLDLLMQKMIPNRPAQPVVPKQPIAKPVTPKPESKSSKQIKTKSKRTRKRRKRRKKAVKK